MTTRRVDIFNTPGSKPDNTGNCVPVALSTVLANDLVHSLGWTFKNAAGRVVKGFRFIVPADYVDTATFHIVYISATNTNSVRAVCDYIGHALNATFDPAAFDETLEATVAANGTALSGFEATLDANDANFTPGEIIEGNWGREADDAADTHAADVHAVAAWFEYDDGV